MPGRVFAEIGLIADTRAYGATCAQASFAPAATIGARRSIPLVLPEGERRKGPAPVSASDERGAADPHAGLSAP
jgi:hypothetical protein